MNLTFTIPALGIDDFEPNTVELWDHPAEGGTMNYVVEFRYDGEVLWQYTTPDPHHAEAAARHVMMVACAVWDPEAIITALNMHYGDHRA